MAREYQNGDGFGYILAFKRKDGPSWMVVRIPHVESSRHVYYNDTVMPYSPFEVKIKAYNRRGEGPFSQIAVVYSAEEGEYTQYCYTSRDTSFVLEMIILIIVFTMIIFTMLIINLIMNMNAFYNKIRRQCFPKVTFFLYGLRNM